MTWVKPGVSYPIGSSTTCRGREVHVATGDDPSQPVTLTAVARDEGYLPLDNAGVEFTVTPMQGEPFQLRGEMDDSEAGTYKATYWSREGGAYRVEANVTAADGSFVGKSHPVGPLSREPLSFKICV